MAIYWTILQLSVSMYTSEKNIPMITFCFFSYSFIKFWFIVIIIQKYMYENFSHHCILNAALEVIADISWYLVCGL